MRPLKFLPVLVIMGMSIKAQSQSCTGSCCKKETTFKCKLSSPELIERKATVIADLKKAMKKRKELKDGYAYKFSGSDEVVAMLNDFVRTEKECCEFFNFNITVSTDKSEAWLEITGEKGVKEFIKKEIDM